MTVSKEGHGIKRMKSSLSRKMLFMILVMALLLSVTAILIGFHVYSSTMDAHYISNTVNLARTAAAILDPDKVEHYTSEVYRIYSSLTPEEIADVNEAYLEKYAYMEKESDWQFMRSQLQKISEENHLNSTMIIAMDEANHTAIYVLDSDKTDTNCPPGTLDDSMTNEDIRNFVNSTAVISNTEEFGWLSSGAAPLHGKDGRITGFVVIDISMNDVMKDRMNFLLNFCVILLLVTAALSALITWLTRRRVVDPINRLAKAATEYSEDQYQNNGNEEGTNHFTGLNIHTGDEVENLSIVMADMETRLGEYIKNLTKVTAEKERISAELNIATQIQADMLPRIFPAFPERSDFDIYASMNPAKEVGGDFYDYFLVDDDHLCMVIADVSGKGVPAALFMVIAKTLIKNRAQLGESPSEILNNVNIQLCDGNEAELFVTVWLAIIELSTGRGMAANAGHEHPAIRRADGRYELSIYKHSPAVAVMDGIRFREHSFELYPGDSLFVYTDGVAEATDVHNQLFGAERMLDALNRDPDATPAQTIVNVREAIDAFVGEAPQFDDITMLGIRYFGPGATPSEVILDAEVSGLDQVLEFVNRKLEEAECPMKTQMQIDIAVEEMFVNIASYAYKPGTGKATIQVRADGKTRTARITLIDSGVPFDPLMKPDPDVTLTAEQRGIGGLGIYMVKKSMDFVTYFRKNEQNTFTMVKKW